MLKARTKHRPKNNLPLPWRRANPNLAYLLPLTIALALALLTPAPAAEPTTDGRLAGTVVRRGDGTPLAVKLFVTLAGKGPSSPEDAALFVKEVDALLDFVPNVPKPLEAETREVFLQACNYYADMAAI